MTAILNWDRVVRFTVCSWFFFLATGLAVNLQDMIETATTGLDFARLFSKSCVFTFILLMGWLTLIRSQPTTRAEGWQPRISAVLGTNLIFVGMIFLAPRTDLSISMHFLSASLILIGNAIAIYTISHLGRSFSIMAEARRLVTNGPYRIVRHPLYIAEQISIIGVAILYASPLAAALVLAQFGFQLRRMLNEEALLKASFPEYAAYMGRTARLIPTIW
jgi:protein-S-isoprenylcysteine O-methyltransferase Ste14